MTPQERIKADAAKFTDKRYKSTGVSSKEYARHMGILDGLKEGYIAGAAAENSREQERDMIFKDAMQQVLNVASWADDPYKSTLRKVVNNAIDKWEGKAEEPVKEIEYMPIHPDDARKFDCPTQFPMHLLNEEQAMRNHSQSLKRLKERGGLSVREILAIVGKKPWSYYSKLPWDEAIKMLNDIVITNPQK